MNLQDTDPPKISTRPWRESRVSEHECGGCSPCYDLLSPLELTRMWRVPTLVSYFLAPGADFRDYFFVDSELGHPFEADYNDHFETRCHFVFYFETSCRFAHAPF